MPVDLPFRKAKPIRIGLLEFLNEWGLCLAIVCFTVALADLVSHAPPSYKAALSAAAYEDMLQGP